MKVFYKGKFYNSVVDGLTVNDVEENYGGFGEDDCYLPECSTYCLLDIDGGVVVPEMGYYDGDECTSGYVNLGDVDVDLSDTEILVDLLQSLGLLVGPVEMFLIDQPMECDMIVDCKVAGESRSVFVKFCDSLSFSRPTLKKRVADSSNAYSKRRKKEMLKDSLLNKARLFKYKQLQKCYIKDDASHVVATTNEGESMLTKFDANNADEAATYLEQNEGQKIVKSDENGIYIGNDTIEESSVRDIQEVNDGRFVRKSAQGVLDSFGKIFNERWSFAGDVRRGVPDFSHVDVVVDSTKANVLKRLKSIKGVKKIKDCTDCVYCECDGVPFEVYPAEGADYVPTLIMLTGTDEFNVMLLANAIESGCYFTEDGVYDEDGEKFCFIDEQDCFDTIGVEYVEPTKRNYF